MISYKWSFMILLLCFWRQIIDPDGVFADQVICRLWIYCWMTLKYSKWVLVNFLLFSYILYFRSINILYMILVPVWWKLIVNILHFGVCGSVNLVGSFIESDFLVKRSLDKSAGKCCLDTRSTFSETLTV